jgi:hypothetical protein
MNLGMIHSLGQSPKFRVGAIHTANQQCCLRGIAELSYGSLLLLTKVLSNYTYCTIEGCQRLIALVSPYVETFFRCFD